MDNNGTMHVAWADGTNYSNSGDDWDIFYNKKPFGSNWTTTEVVSTESVNQSSRPSLAVDNSGTIHISWEENTELGDYGSNYDILYKKKPFDGSWSKTEVVSTESTSNSLNPYLVVEDNGTVPVSYTHLTLPTN